MKTWSLGSQRLDRWWKRKLTEVPSHIRQWREGQKDLTCSISRCNTTNEPITIMSWVGIMQEMHWVPSTSVVLVGGVAYVGMLLDANVSSHFVWTYFPLSFAGFLMTPNRYRLNRCLQQSQYKNTYQSSLSVGHAIPIGLVGLYLFERIALKALRVLPSLPQTSISLH